MYLELKKSHLDNFENHTVGLSPTLTNWNKIAGERDWHLTYEMFPRRYDPQWGPRSTGIELRTSFKDGPNLFHSWLWPLSIQQTFAQMNRRAFSLCVLISLGESPLCHSLSCLPQISVPLTWLCFQINWKVLKILIPRLHSRSLNHNHWGGTQEFVFLKTLQMILTCCFLWKSLPCCMSISLTKDTSPQ